jgi:hypothetical protein
MTATAAPIARPAVDKSPSSPEVVATINKHLDAMVDYLSYLRSRWNDERGCEDFSDYVKVLCDKLKSHIPEADDIKATKWLVSFRLPNNRWYSYYLKGSSGGWKRIK